MLVPLKNLISCANTTQRVRWEQGCEAPAPNHPAASKLPQSVMAHSAVSLPVKKRKLDSIMSDFNEAVVTQNNLRNSIAQTQPTRMDPGSTLTLPQHLQPQPVCASAHSVSRCTVVESDQRKNPLSGMFKSNAATRENNFVTMQTSQLNRVSSAYNKFLNM